VIEDENYLNWNHLRDKTVKGHILISDTLLFQVQKEINHHKPPELTLTWQVTEQWHYKET
jgi:hypothetical protein